MHFNFQFYTVCSRIWGERINSKLSQFFTFCWCIMFCNHHGLSACYVWIICAPYFIILCAIKMLPTFYCLRILISNILLIFPATIQVAIFKKLLNLQNWDLTEIFCVMVRFLLFMICGKHECSKIMSRNFWIWHRGWKDFLKKTIFLIMVNLMQVSYVFSDSLVQGPSV